MGTSLMRIEHLSKQDAIILLEMISESLACSTEEQVLRLMGKLSALLPYQAALSCISKLGANGAIEDLKVVNVDYPADYLAELAKRELVMKDPVVRENFKSFRLQYWADTFKQQPLTRDIHTIFSLAEDYGFHKVSTGCGYGHGVRNLKGTEGSFFCYQGLDRSSRTEEILSLVFPTSTRRCAARETLRKTDRPSPRKKPRSSSGSGRERAPGTSP